MTPNEIRRMVASKDYTAIAAAFADEVTLLLDIQGKVNHPASMAERQTVRRLANRLVMALKADNPKFDGPAFLKACGLDRLPR